MNKTKKIDFNKPKLEILFTKILDIIWMAVFYAIIRYIIV